MKILDEKAPRPALTLRVIEVLRARIAANDLKPGDRLPTEQALVREFGVSRTVIREAIAGLRADGLVQSRQGAGVFVLPPPAPNGTRNGPLLRAGTDRFSSIIEALELRTAVEVEAAGLAASRSSPAQQMRIREAFNEMTEAVGRGQRAEETDFAFHLRIAEATNNPLFREFLEFLGARTIPRRQVDNLNSIAEDYLAQIQHEHHTIMESIAKGNAVEARNAMRKHLRGSQERYQNLMPTAG